MSGPVPLQGGHHRLSTVADVEPYQNRADVTLDRGFGDPQQVCYFFVAQAIDQAAQHFLFPRTQT
jgi:hypothetical protein